MREMDVELEQLRMHGMAGAWADLVEQGGGGSGGAAIEGSRWLFEHLLQAGTADRAMRSVSHQMHTARFSVHRDLAGFDFEVSPVDHKLIHTLAEMRFCTALVGRPAAGGGRQPVEASSGELAEVGLDERAVVLAAPAGVAAWILGLEEGRADHLAQLALDPGADVDHRPIDADLISSQQAPT